MAQSRQFNTRYYREHDGKPSPMLLLFGLVAATGNVTAYHSHTHEPDWNWLWLRDEDLEELVGRNGSEEIKTI